MSTMPMLPPAVEALLAAAMMFAMMVPAVAPTLWRLDGQLRATRTPYAGPRTMLFTGGYASVWIVIGLVLFVVRAALDVSGFTSVAASFALLPGVVVLGAGVVQRSDWKAMLLLRCRETCWRTSALSVGLDAAWWEGCRLGLDCALSCAAPMAVLVMLGLMDLRAMAALTAAITAERVAPAGARIARATGALAMLMGALMCARALAGAMTGGA